MAEADFNIDDITVKTAVVSGLGNTRELLGKIERGEVHYDFVEVMACPGGCVGGGGQPIHDGEELAFERGRKLYRLDENAAVRFSHENQDILQMYEEFLRRLFPIRHIHYSIWSICITKHKKQEEEV